MLLEKSVELIQELNVLIKKYSSNNKVRNIILEEFDRHNMRGDLAIEIINEKRELSTLNIDEGKDLLLLIVFTNAMFKALMFKEDANDLTLGKTDEILKITPENYFLPKEIIDLDSYREEKKINTKQRHVFHNMSRRADSHFAGPMTNKNLTSIDAVNDILYSFETQRDPIIDVYGMKRIRIDKNKIETITNRLLSGTQFSDDIKLNLLQDGEDELEFNEKTGDLTIISGSLMIFDGYHRKTAGVQAQKLNPSLDFTWGLVITNFSEKRTQEFMSQINEQKRMSSKHIKNLDSSKMGNIAVNVLKDIDTSEFAQNIRESDAELKFGGLILKSLLAQSIEEAYGEKLTRGTAKPIAKHIANIMDYIIQSNMEEFISEHDDFSKVTHIAHKNMFAGYIALSEHLYQVNEWEGIIDEVLEKIDFSVKNPYWKDIGVLETDMKKSTRNNLYKFFRKLV